MKTATISQNELKTAATQMAYKTEQAIMALDKQIGKATEALTSAQAGMQRITDTAEQRKHHVEDVHTSKQNAVTALAEARIYAQRAQGTLGEREAVRKVKELEDTLASLDHNLLKAEEEDARVTPRESKQLGDLQAQIESLTRDIAGYRQQQEDERIALRQALVNLGNATYQGAVDDMERRNRSLQDAKRKVLDEQIALERQREAAMAELSDWPELQERLRAQLPYKEDSATRLLEGAIAYFKSLSRDGAEARTLIDTTLLRQIIPYNDGLTSFFRLDMDEFYRIFTGREAPTLRDHVAQCSRLLELYTKAQ